MKQNVGLTNTETVVKLPDLLKYLFEGPHKFTLSSFVEIGWHVFRKVGSDVCAILDVQERRIDNRRLNCSK